MNIHPAGAVGPSLQLSRQPGEKFRRLCALDDEEGVHAFQGGVDVPGADGFDLINQNVDPFPGQQARQSFWFFRHVGRDTTEWIETQALPRISGSLLRSTLHQPMGVGMH